MLPLLVGGGIAATRTPPAVVLTIGVCVASFVARRRRRRRDRRCRSEGRAVAAALEVLVGELKVGAHPVRAFTIAAAEADAGVGPALTAVAMRARFGADVAAGLRSIATDSAVPACWDRLAVCWQLAAEHGLAMSTLMAAARQDIVGRQRFSDRIDAGVAGARATAAILAGLPVLGVVLGQLIGARPLALLLGGGIGGWLLLAGVGLICLGVAWSDRIVDRVRA